MRMLDCLADRNKQLKTLAWCQVHAVAILRDRHTLDEFHHEKWSSSIACASVEHPRDIGMIHHRKRLALGFEARDDLRRVHAGLDHLQGHAPLHRRMLFGLEDDAHATLA